MAIINAKNNVCTDKPSFHALKVRTGHAVSSYQAINKFVHELFLPLV